MIGVIESECAQQGDNACSYIHNGGPRSQESFDFFNAAAKAIGRPIQSCSGGDLDFGIGTIGNSGSAGQPPASAINASSTFAACFIAMIGLLSNLL